MYSSRVIRVFKLTTYRKWETKFRMWVCVWVRENKQKIIDSFQNDFFIILFFLYLPTVFFFFFWLHFYNLHIHTNNIQSFSFCLFLSLSLSLLTAEQFHNNIYHYNNIIFAQISMQYTYTTIRLYNAWFFTRFFLPPIDHNNCSVLYIHASNKGWWKRYK